MATARARKTASSTTTAPVPAKKAAATKKRRTADAVPGSAEAGMLAGNIANQGLGASPWFTTKPEDEESVLVNIPHAFKLQGHDRIIYQYEAGNRQYMPRSHADHPYSADNGVKHVKDAKK